MLHMFSYSTTNSKRITAFYRDFLSRLFLSAFARTSHSDEPCHSSKNFSSFSPFRHGHICSFEYCYSMSNWSSMGHDKNVQFENETNFLLLGLEPIERFSLSCLSFSISDFELWNGCGRLALFCWCDQVRKGTLYYLFYSVFVSINCILIVYYFCTEKSIGAPVSGVSIVCSSCQTSTTGLVWLFSHIVISLF